jgi:hypothetical protein
MSEPLTLSVSGVAERLGIGRAAVYRLIEDGRLKPLSWCGPGKAEERVSAGLHRPVSL